MDIFICEFVSGGGLASEDVSSSLFSEAFAMLRVLASGFAASGDQVVTLLDERIAPIKEILPATTAFTINSKADFFRKLKEQAANTDLVVCVAPETDGCLYHCSQLLEKAAPGRLIGCSKEFVELAGDKWQTAQHLDSMKLPTPKTHLTTFGEADAYLRENPGSYVVKPRDGVSGEGLVLVSTPNDLENALQHFSYLRDEKFLLQEFIEGRHGSLSFVCGETPMPVSANRQIIDINEKGFFEYSGGEIPWDHPQIPAVLEKGLKFLENSPGSKGWIGIDFVLNSSNHWLIECNPRVTSSIVGAWTLDSQAIGANLKASLNFEDYRSLPSGYTIFKKMACKGTETWDETQLLAEMPGIVSPPFAFQDFASAFLTAKGKTRKEAQQRILQIESNFKESTHHGAI
ncbi:MAG: ATP-grasp domain-containing protein [Candidatus Thorarchaeota archaeon]